MIRPYSTSDDKVLIEIFRKNTPDYFDPSEEKDYIQYLKDWSKHYQVIEIDNKVVGGGGINYMEDQTVRISWDLLDPDFQGKGLGGELLRHRIQQIKSKKETGKIVVRTSQLVYGFYAKFGFELVEIKKDFWAEGFDLYEMALEY